MSNEVAKFLGMDETEFEKIEEEKPSGSGAVLDSGVYKAKIKEIGQFKGEKGGVQIKIAVTLDEFLDHEVSKYPVIVTKDGVKSEWGPREVKHVISAANIDPTTVTQVQGKMKAYNKEVDAILLKGVEGKPLKIALRKVHDPEGKYEWYNEIEHFMRVDGTNAKGEDLEGPFLKKIEKNPILERKSKKTNTADTTVKTANGTDIASLI